MSNLNELLEDKSTPQDVTLEKVASTAIQNYALGMEHLYSILSGMSARSIMRSVLFAIDHDIDLYCPVELQRKDVDTAALIAKILDLRTMIQANRLRVEQQTKGTENGKQ